VATGETHSVRQLCEVAFERAGLNYENHVRIDERFMRPAEVDHLVGNAAKARDQLGWRTTVDFAGLVESMVDADIDLIRGRVS
jgi:GDPmannose 4,6-dehydratase